MSDQSSSNSTSVSSASSSNEEKSRPTAIRISNEDFREDAGVEEGLYAYLIREILITRLRRYCDFCISFINQDSSLNKFQKAEIIQQIKSQYQTWFKIANTNVKEALSDAFRFIGYTSSQAKSLEDISNLEKANLNEVQKMSFDDMQKLSLFESPLPAIKVLVDQIVDLERSDDLDVEEGLFDRIKQLQGALNSLSPEKQDNPSFASIFNICFQLNEIISYSPRLAASHPEEERSEAEKQALQKALEKREHDSEKFKQLLNYYYTKLTTNYISEQELFDYFDTAYPFLNHQEKNFALGMLGKDESAFSIGCRRLAAKNRCNLWDTIKATLQKLWSEVKNRDRWLTPLLFFTTLAFGIWSIVSQATIFNIPFIAINAPILAVIFAVLTGLKLLWDFFATRPDYYQYCKDKFKEKFSNGEHFQPEFYQSADVPFFRLYLLAYNQMHWFWRYAALALVTVGLGLITYGLTISTTLTPENTWLILGGVAGAAVVLVLHAIHIAGNAYELFAAENDGASKTSESSSVSNVSDQYANVHYKVISQSYASLVTPSSRPEIAASAASTDVGDHTFSSKF
ncbi:MAG: hypothetical protein M1561_04210 [Gammaproteobacteria bacterium]|nr:hypothetical protein [Gammaproteobacteria bacterium]